MNSVKYFTQGSHRPAVGGGYNIALSEAPMTIQSVWTSPLLIGKERVKQSFLHRWIASIAASRQEKADEVVKEYLQRQAENLDRSKL